MGCHFLLQGIFPTQGSNPGLPHCRQTLLPSEPPGKPRYKIKYTNIYIIEVPEGEEREKGLDKIFEEIIAEKFPNMGKEIVNQVQEVQGPSGRINPRRNTPRHIVIKLTNKDRDKY